MVATARVTWWLLGFRGQFLHQAGDTSHECVIQRWVCKASCCHPPTGPSSWTLVIQLSFGREDITQPCLGWASTSAGVKTRVMTARVCGWWDLNTPQLLWLQTSLGTFDSFTDPWNTTVGSNVPQDGRIPMAPRRGWHLPRSIKAPTQFTKSISFGGGTLTANRGKLTC